MKMKIKKGFSLLELTLVLGVGTIVAFMKFQDMKNEQESILASAVGQQMKQIGEAVNGYINIRYDKLSTLSNAAGTGTDPGPRTCSGSVCEITYQTLINEGLLPSAFTGTNANRSSYKIILKRDGTTPNYVINGLITTSNPWSEGGKTRFDLLGKAMQTAGIDSGMTKSNTKADGYNGSWSEQSTSFNNITKAGQLVFRAGYNASLYSAYLRRDGTLPMTGNLNMGNNDINNAKNITASGTGNFGSNVNSGGNVTAAAQVIAHNGYGDTITLGGDAAGNDYEIRLGTAKPLTLYSPSAGNYTTVLQVNRNTKIDQRLGLMGYDPNELPSGWGGGLRTLDVYAAGTVGTGSGGTVNAYMNSSGNIYASNDINAGHQVNAQYVWASGNLNSNYIHSNGNIDANGRINAGEFVYINGQANIGWGCSPNGVVGRTPEGKVISCVNGVWSGSTGSPVIRTAYASAYRFPGAVAYCAGSEKVVGGGGQCNTAEGYVWLTVSRPNGDNSWYAGCDTTKNITATITVYAICQ
ncbi:shufflon system plasmid conjugative transfer pilus tip adhesin PilV [Escherichia coli]|uniref:shufflon system plasmid conjugative transfer pilus tip adhesin PilV n=1 Tax=Enterobacteriaceae TaxID=543 RepID=UPI00165945B9|nr:MULTISPECIES: shufflon system plasmid conjugative transfer pilus tip adhesin PilV [Enterobacteriaceae]EDE2461072.1 shufflon system plasmid conjugative transfer pilus tip adhesin PilV [Salmonella enterica subsp. enterica serovar Pensacola]EMC2032219.1 shufflon system plasmid conjugative transfer pilus tip adhesin PilV [Escherichia coli]MBC9650998.1 shufflon system plasmid conjugative transfer pilus tip adhesin PilV [Escherichia coli]MDH4884657.1 shufflon system plasmid conjugative transfer pi